ncbi:MAG: hypothetical protein ABI769_09025 [Pseudomonadota bacterium]
MKLSPVATLLIAATLGLAACGHKADEATLPSPSGTAPSASTKLSSASFSHGGSREALVEYLKTVRETPAKKFEVTFNSDVVKINRQEAIDTLQAVSVDGAEFRFTDTSRTRELQPGKILFLWGVALRRITAASAMGGQWVVTTTQVSLPEVFREADIDFDYPLDARQAFATFRPPAPPKTAAAGQPDGLMRVAFINDARADDAPPAGPTIVDLPNSFAMSASGIDFELSYQPIEGGMHFDIEARKQQSDVQPDPPGGGQGLAQGLFDKGSDQWDLRIKASGDFNGISSGDSLAVSNQLQIQGSALGLLKTEFRNVNGKVKLQFIARRGKSTEQWFEKLKVDIPIRINIPVIVGGLPMVFQVGFDLIVQPALTTKNDTFDAAYEIPFSGNGTVQLEGNKFTVGGTLATEPHPLKTLGSSIGVSAILVAVQAPRIGLGIGVFGASSVMYIDLVSSATITSGGQLGLLPCKQYQLVASINAGVDTKIAFDLPGWAKFLNGPLNEKLKEANQAASLREQIFKKEWYRVEPDMPVCRPKAG